MSRYGTRATLFYNQCSNNVTIYCDNGKHLEEVLAFFEKHNIYVWHSHSIDMKVQVILSRTKLDEVKNLMKEEGL